MDTPQPTEEEWQSPCIGICRLDDHGRCIGCQRTMEEIKQAYERLQAKAGRSPH